MLDLTAPAVRGAIRNAENARKLADSAVAVGDEWNAANAANRNGTIGAP